jgi:hypothetical protein
MATINLGSGVTSGSSVGITGLSGDVTTTAPVNGVAVATVGSIGGKVASILPTANTIVQRDSLGNTSFNLVSATNMFISTPSNAPTAVATNAFVLAAVVLNSLQIYDADGVESVNNLSNIETTNWIGYILSDGHVIVAGDFILLTEQTDLTQNLLWKVDVSGFFVRPLGWEIGVNIAGFRISIVDYTNVSDRDGWSYQQIAQHVIGELPPPPIYRVIGKGSNLHGDGVTIVQPSANTLSVGVISAANLGVDSVLSSAIAPGVVGTDKLANSAVTNAKLANDAVGTDKLANDAVTNAKLANGAVSMSKLDALAVGTGNIADSAVTNAKLATEVQTQLVAAGGTFASEYYAGNKTWQSLITNASLPNASTVLIADITGSLIRSSGFSFLGLLQQQMSIINNTALFVLGGTPTPNTVGNSATVFRIPLNSISPIQNSGISTSVSGTTTNWSISIPASTTEKMVEIEVDLLAVFGGGTNNSVAAFEVGFSISSATFSIVGGSSTGFVYNQGYNNSGGGTIAASFPSKAKMTYIGTGGMTCYLIYTGFSRQNGTNTTTVTISPYSTATNIISYMRIKETG